MILAVDLPPNPSSSPPIETLSGATESSWVSRDEPDFEKWIESDSDIKYLPIEGGKLLLRLVSPASLSINYKTKECRVEGWALTVPLYETHRLPREMARKFLDLFSKAQNDLLTEQERSEWFDIVDQVDYTSFSVDRSAPHYIEGTVLQDSPCRVEWHDGSKEKLAPTVAASLSSLNRGDSFGAYVKLGRDNKARSIKRILILPPALSEN